MEVVFRGMRLGSIEAQYASYSHAMLRKVYIGGVNRDPEGSLWAAFIPYRTLFAAVNALSGMK